MAHGAILGQKLEDALLVDGSKSMQANLNMNNHKITNVTNGRFKWRNNDWHYQYG